MRARFTGFVLGKWEWAKQNPLFWANLALGTLTYLLVFVFPGPSDLRLRIWSMALQLLGAMIVWWDLTGAARTFGRGGFVKSTLEWLKACFVGSRALVGADICTNYAILGQPCLSQRRPVVPGDPIEARLKALEYNFAQIDSEISRVSGEIANQSVKLNKRVTEESIKREAANSALELRLQEAIIGNYTTLAFGAAWVFVGIVLSSLAPEITRIIEGQWATVWAAL